MTTMQHRALACLLVLAVGCDGAAEPLTSGRTGEPTGPEAVVDTPVVVEDPWHEPGLVDGPEEEDPGDPSGDADGDGYADGPADYGTLTGEWRERLDARELDYGAALRTASLRLRGTMPTLLEIRFVAEAPDPKVAYEGMVDSFLEDPRFTVELLRFFRDTMKMGGTAELDTAPLFATWLAVAGQPFTKVFTATSGNCPTFDSATGTITPAECGNGVPAHAGVLTNPAVQKHFFSNLAFRRVRWLQETFACRAYPAEFGEPTDIGGAAAYTAPWPFESIAGADTGGRIDFHDTTAVICANCHATMNHIAPLFGRFDANGAWTDDIAVPLPLEGFPLVTLSDWLPPGQTTAWRFGVPVTDLPGLGAAMASDAEVHSCIAARVWNWAMGKGDVVAALEVVPEEVLAEPLAAYFDSTYRLKELIRATFTADDFVRF